MQSLSDNTLAAFMKSDITPKDLEIPSSNSSSKRVVEKPSNSCMSNKNNSDLAKYFNDSLVFLSRDTNREKENNPPQSIELDIVPESPKNISVPKPKNSGSDKYLLNITSPKCSINPKNPRAKKKVKTSTKKKKYTQLSIQLGATKEENFISSNTQNEIQISDNHVIESSAKLSRNNCSEILGRSREISTNNLEQKCSNQTTNSSIEIPSSVATLDRCKLSSWGLPLTILRKYEARGVTSMFPWQVECLSNRELLEKNKNLVYSAPTSAGKTLVAEILVIKTVIERRKKVIFILPFISVVREKMYYFQDLLSESGVRVEGFMGGCVPSGGFSATDVAIATIEKANSLLNQLMEEGNLVNLGAVVIDELHLLGDSHRGYLLELLLTKLKYMNLREELVHVQLIGMSATLPNLAILAKWLNAELYKTDFRPIPLNEFCKIGSTIYDNKMNSLRILPIIQQLSGDSDNIIQLCIETISDGHSVLIFCPTKNWCENLAQQIASTFSKLGRENSPIGRCLREQLSLENIMETLEQLKRCPIGLDSVLKNTVSFGAAFHHAGLTMDERDIVEGAFRAGALRVLTATSTLSSGVNLPARRVIIRSLMAHGKPLDTLTYRQMIGRAGRMGKDTSGESILVCKTNETKTASNLLSAQLQPIESCLEGSEPLIRALLEAIASEVAYTAKDIDLYIKCTLVSFTNHDLIEKSTKEAINYLVDNEFLMLQKTKTGEERWIATPLGKACLAASIPPSDGLFIFEELQKARRAFVLDTELHVIYLVTPLNSSNQIGQIDWIVYLDLWKSISESERRVGQLVGVEESFLISAIRGIVRPGKMLDVHKRFYTALALHELVREVSLSEVCRKYGCNRGVIQGLQQSASNFAGMITQFSKKLGWNCMELLIGQFQARLEFGVCRELLDLLKLPMLNGLRARSLFKEGITCVAELALANELDVERALHKALPFESGKEHEGEHEVDAAKRNKMRSVFVTGRDGLTPREAAVILVREARTLVQNELGLDELQWNQRECSTKSTDRTTNYQIFSNRISEQISSINNSLGKTTDDVATVDYNNRGNYKKAENLQGEELKLNTRGTEANIESIEHVSYPIESSQRNSETIESIQLISKTIESNQIISKTIESNQIISKTIESNQIISKTIESSNTCTGDGKIDSEVFEAICDVEIFKFTDQTEFELEKKIETTNKSGGILKTIKSNQICTRDKKNDVQASDDICDEEIFEFTDQTEIQLEKKIETTNKSGGILKTIKSNQICIRDKKNDVQASDDICDEEIFEFTDQNEIQLEKKIETNSKSVGILKTTKTNQICTRDKKIDIQTSDVICDEEIFEFTDQTEIQLEKKIETNSKSGGILKTTKSNQICTRDKKIDVQTSDVICDEEIFEFTDQTEIQLEKKIETNSKSGGILKTTKTNQICTRDKKIDIQTSDVICDEEIFEFTDQTEIQLEKKAETTSKSSTASPAVLLIRESLTKSSESRSPSLFGDSLNLDTQECNILEQNVIDSLNISAFGDTIFSGATELQKNTPKRRSSESARPNLHSNSKSQQKTSVKKFTARQSPEISELKNKSKSIAWDDDSWNNTNGVIEKVNQLYNASSRVNIGNNLANISQKDPNEKIISITPVLKNKHEKILTPKNRLTELRKIPQKRKLSEPDLEKSPIASILTFPATRRISVDSNKSDSDDVIIPSQSLNPLTCGAKNRTRLKLESLRRSRTQRGTTPTISGAIERKEKPKNFKQSGINTCSIDSCSVVSNSDDEVPMKRPNALIKSSTAQPATKTSLQRKKALGAEKTTADGSRNKKMQSIKIIEPQITIITNNLSAFNIFKQKFVGKNDIALALGCESFSKNSATIGTKIIGITGADGRKKSKKIDNCIHGNKKLCGVSISWDGVDVHYISFDNNQDSKVPVKERLDLLTEILNNENLTVRCFAFKETYKILYNCCSIAPTCKFLDPKIADWLLDPDHSERNFNALINEHLSEAKFLLQRTGTNNSEAGPGLNVQSAVNSQSRATTEAILTWHLMNTLITKLGKRSPTLLATFKEVEMGTVTVLARMELSGIGVNLKSLQELSDVIQQEMSQLEKKAYSLAGKTFNFTSSKSVAQVLGLYKGKKVSTNKAALEHCENPISSLVTSWRKLSTTQIKIVFPLLRRAECNSRVYGNCLTNTATGRVSMHEPNLQNVPRDFNSQDGSFVISVRMAFAPIIGNIILSADYCQLELRIMAHFSKEPNLCKILRKEGDVFKNIAARWFNVAEEKIDDCMRQRTKQLCYGMIYGMGVKTLAETLAVTETEAKEFLETFMSAYPGIRRWLTQVVDEARVNGYVKTLMHRRRYFPALDSPVPSERGQAERQAVNTKVQGSAADIAKKAMVVIDERIRREFPDAPLVLADAPIKRKLRSHSKDPLPRGGFLVLQIHDELLYEVNAADLQQVAKIIQESMEHSCTLRVPLPVKLKIGPTWGDLTEYKCQS